VRYILFLLLGCFSLLSATAQRNKTVILTTDRQQIFLGEQIQVDAVLEIDAPDLAKVNWFALPDSVNHLEVVGAAKIDTVENGSTIALHQQFFITGFDSGRWIFPPMKLMTANGMMQTDSLVIDVQPVDISKMKDFHDIKEIMDVPANNQLRYMLIFGLALLLAILGLIYFLRKRWVARAEEKKGIIDIGNQNPFDWAMKELELMKQQVPSTPELVEPYYTQMDSIYRTYVHNRFGVRAFQKTSSEMLDYLNTTQLVRDDLAQYTSTVRLIDVVKFARFMPSMQEGAQHVDVIKNVIQQLEKKAS
jgi:hypothetical protein